MTDELNGGHAGRSPWERDRKDVMRTLERLEKQIQITQDLRVEVAVIKTKLVLYSSIVGLLAGIAGQMLVHKIAG